VAKKTTVKAMPSNKKIRKTCKNGTTDLMTGTDLRPMFETEGRPCDEKQKKLSHGDGSGNKKSGKEKKAREEGKNSSSDSNMSRHGMRSKL